MSAERKIERSFIRSALERNTDGLNRIERPRAAGRPRTFNRPGANGRPLPITRITAVRWRLEAFNAVP